MAMSKKRANEITKKLAAQKRNDTNLSPEDPRMFVQFFPADETPNEIKIPVEKPEESFGVACRSFNWHDDHLQFVGELPNGQMVNVRMFWRDLPIYKAIRKQLILNLNNSKFGSIIEEDCDHEK